MGGLIKSILSIIVFFSFCFYIPQQANCQERRGLTGIGVQLGTPPPYFYTYAALFPGVMEMQPDVLISTWLTDQIALEPSIGILAFTNQTFWRLGLSCVNHFGHERLTPFILLRGKAYLTSSAGTKGTDYHFTLAAGGEYFVSEKFSLSGECQLNYLITDKTKSIFLNENITFTGVGVSGRFYLN